MAVIKSTESKLTRNWGWVVTFASFVMNFFGFGILYCFSITFVFLQEEFSTDSSATSWAGSIPIGLATGSGVIVTPLVSRYENRPVAIAGVFLCCLSCLLTSVINDFKLIYLTYSALYGLGIGFCSLASMDLLLRYFPKKNCSRATLISLGGSSSGMLALGPLTYILIENLGWRNMFRVLGTLLLVVAMPATMTFSRPNVHNQTGSADDGDDAMKGDSTSADGETSKQITFGGDRTHDKGTYDNMGFVAEGSNRHDKTINHRSHLGVNKISSNAVLTKQQQVDNDSIVRNCLGVCPAGERRPVDIPDQAKAGPDQLDSVTLIANDVVIHIETATQSYRQPTPNAEDNADRVNVGDLKASLKDSTAKDGFVSFKIMTISSSSSYEVSSIYDVDGTDVEGHATPPVVAQQKHSRAEQGRDHQGFFRRYRAFFYPELWLISICITGLPMMNTFYYINMGDFLISRGFERNVIPWVVTTFGISEVAGKILLAVIADRLPFPKIFIYHFACAVGIVVMGCLLVVRSVASLLSLAVATGLIVMMVADALAYSICNQVFRPQDVIHTWTVVMVTQGLGYMLGSLFGESIDRTGSYNDAIYTSVGIYALCGLACTAVPMYQKFFAPERLVMFEYQDACRRKRSMKKRYKPDDLMKVSQ